jgi:mRNA interferase MazF
VRRGEVWTYAFGRPDKLRPVVVLTRDVAIAHLHAVMVAPITSTIRGAPSEVLVGIAEGLAHESAVNLDHVQTVERSALRRRRGSLGSAKMAEICHALAVATGCDSGPPVPPAMIESVAEAVAAYRRKASGPRRRPVPRKGTERRRPR